MEKNKENPGKLNVSQTLDSAGPEKKNIIDLTIYKKEKDVWVSITRPGFFRIGKIYEDELCEFLGEIEKGKILAVTIYDEIVSSDFAFQCWTHHSASFLRENCVKPDDLYIEVCQIDAMTMTVKIWRGDDVLESFKIEGEL